MVYFSIPLNLASRISRFFVRDIRNSGFFFVFFLFWFIFVRKIYRGLGKNRDHRSSVARGEEIEYWILRMRWHHSENWFYHHSNEMPKIHLRLSHWIFFGFWLLFSFECSMLSECSKWIFFNALCLCLQCQFKRKIDSRTKKYRSFRPKLLGKMMSHNVRFRSYNIHSHQWPVTASTYDLFILKIFNLLSNRWRTFIPTVSKYTDSFKVINCCWWLLCLQQFFCVYQNENPMSNWNGPNHRRLAYLK